MLGKLLIVFVFSSVFIINHGVVGDANSIPRKTTLRRIKGNTVQCGPTQIGLLPHPHDCTKFLNCNQGLTYIQDCGEGTMFNPAHNGCDYPQNVNCPTNTIPNVAPQSVTEAPQFTSNPSTTFYKEVESAIDLDESLDSRSKCGLNYTPNNKIA